CVVEQLEIDRAMERVCGVEEFLRDGDRNHGGAFRDLDRRLVDEPVHRRRQIHSLELLEMLRHHGFRWTSAVHLPGTVPGAPTSAFSTHDFRAASVDSTFTSVAI